MKNTIKLIVLFISLFVGVFAQTELPMIKSRAALLAYGVSQARETNGYLYSDAIASDGYDFKIWSGQKSALDVLEQVKLLKLTGETVDPKSHVYVYVMVNNSDGDTLFYGYTDSIPVQTNGVWELPQSASNIELVASAQPIRFDKQVSSAVMISKDSNGNTQFSELNVNGNKVWFSPESTGLKDAYLRISYTDGTSVSYSVATGEVLPTYAMTATLSPTFKDLYTFKNPVVMSIISLKVKSQNGKGIIPTVEVTLDSARSVVFDIGTDEGKHPVKLWLKTGNTTWTSVPANSNGSTEVALLGGITYVVPEWNVVEFSEVSQPVATGGGGKG